MKNIHENIEDSDINLGPSTSSKVQTIEKSTKQLNIPADRDGGFNDNNSDSASADAETHEPETTNQDRTINVPVNLNSSVGSFSIHLVSDDPGKWPANMNPSEVQFVYKISNAAITAIEERFQLLQQHTAIFSVIYGITKVKNDDELKTNCEKVNQALTNISSSETDISATDLYEKIKAIQPFFFSQKKSTSDILEFIYNSLISTFPNLTIMIRIFLTLPVTVARGERSFSKLKIIQNYLRSSMEQDILSALAMLSIEHDVCATLDIKDIVKKVSETKARKVRF
ncbi:unnamed protein product [Diabrotica balteata]|uniref:HAT C-terminal dimerisation domain-containing protein n=1 Tax=Diabrotica balteata TaxID=107213 RepID=A0A9N9SVP8_DIABA|nr:unnamed protein product [Diabrotica balteata]